MNFRCIKVRDDIINKILYDYEAKIIEIDKLENISYYEYRKNIIYIKDTKKIICSGIILNYYCNTDLNPWQQVVCEPAANTEKIVEDAVDGSRAWNYIIKILCKKYTRNEVESILTSYDTKTNYDKQFIYILPKVSQNVQKLPLCVKYDINGAHTDALCEMFPKCKQDFINMYHKRHKQERYKIYPNYFVGMLQHYGYSGAYWWIVNRTTKILFNAIDKVGGTLIYARTDGFCVQNPEHKLPVSKELGKFKEEYKGTVYYFNNNKKSPYYLYQFGNDMKGSCITAVRNNIDLSKGQVVYYNRVSYGNSYLPENIEKETIEIDG